MDITTPQQPAGQSGPATSLQGGSATPAGADEVRLCSFACCLPVSEAPDSGVKCWSVAADRKSLALMVCRLGHCEP